MPLPDARARRRFEAARVPTGREDGIKLVERIPVPRCPCLWGAWPAAQAWRHESAVYVIPPHILTFQSPFGLGCGRLQARRHKRLEPRCAAVRPAKER